MHSEKQGYTKGVYVAVAEAMLGILGALFKSLMSK